MFSQTDQRLDPMLPIVPVERDRRGLMNGERSMRTLPYVSHPPFLAKLGPPAREPDRHVDVALGSDSGPVCRP